MKRNLLIPVLTLCTLLISGSSIAQKEESKSFKGVKSIRMSTASGDCKIVKSSDGSVSVNVRHDYESKEFEPIMEQNGDRLEISEDYHVRNSTRYGNVRWTLTVPEGVSIRFKTGSGNVEASGMRLSLEATTGSGDLMFRKVTGEITGNTGSGDIELEDFDGNIDFNAGSGSARILNSKGDLRVQCGSGNIRLTDSQAIFDTNTGSGNVVARNVTLSGRSRFNSGSGDAQVGLAVTPKFDISVGSGSGNSELNFGGNEIAGEITMRASKNHGSIVAPFEFEKVEESMEGGDHVVVTKSTVKGNAAVKVRVSTGSGEAAIRK